MPNETENLNFQKHISNNFNHELERLKTELLEMGGLVEQQITEALAAIVNDDSEAAERVLASEDRVDDMEMAIDEHCTTILARRQPTASDLRMVLTVSKITRDLERIGDEAAKVAKMAVQINKGLNSSHKGYVELRNIGEAVRSMVAKSMDAFSHFDTQDALEVVRKDQLVDDEYAVTMRTLVTYMMEDPRSISMSMSIIWALRSLERIGDHSRNIAEHVVYLVKGTDVRHIEYDDMEKRIR